MEYARRRSRPAHGNSHGRVLKPAKNKSHIVVWFGVPLMLLVVGVVALCLYSGSEVERCREAAENGDAEAMHNLGRLHGNGKGINKDKSKAGELSGSELERHRKAAEKGDVQAMLNLGMDYYFGDGVEKDLGEAVAWFKRAAEHAEQNSNGVYATALLGVCYQDAGRMDEAVKWYRKAAEKGDVQSMHILGNCYCTGKGVEQDFYEAAKWWRKEAVLGTPEEKARAKKLLREVSSLLQ